MPEASTHGKLKRPPLGRRGFTVSLVVAPTLLILFFMMGFIHTGADGSGVSLQFPEMLRVNTPTSGDTGAHVLLPRIIEDMNFRVGWPLGWSNAWFAGFPVLYLYFPLPMLAIVVLDTLLPYGVAFKMVHAAGLVALPAATYFMVRWMGFERIVAALAAVTGGVSVFMESHQVLGGNIKSVILGEFSFSWSLALLAVFIGLIVRDAEVRRRIEPWPGIVLGLVAVSHIVSVVVGVAVSALLLFQKSRRAVVLVSWTLGFSLVGFWAVPFAVLVLQGMSPNSNWSAVTDLIGSASPLPIDLAPILPFAAVGVLWSLRRGDRVAPIIGLATIPLAAYFLLPVLGPSMIYNGRFLPFWYYGVFVLGGIGIGRCVVAVGSRIQARVDGVALMAAIAAAIVMVVAVLAISVVPTWVQRSYSGYEGRVEYPQYRQLMDTVDALPAGRVAWEWNTLIGAYGTPLALSLFPYWSPEHPSMQGLYYESSLTTPFNFINESEISRDPSTRIPGLRYHSMDFARATAHLALYDVDYYVSFTDEAEGRASDFGLEVVAEAPPWTVFALPPSQSVDVATVEPVVWDGASDFSDAALEWYDDVDNLDHWLVASGPGSWARVDSVDERLSAPSEAGFEAGAVSNILIEDDRISFDTTAIGVPHLVKVSYFPNWRSEGADGPFRAAPSLMVVVPTESSVVVYFGRTWAEVVGLVLTLLAVIGVAAWGFRVLRAHRARGRPG
jgi:hypothetical protein